MTEAIGVVAPATRRTAGAVTLARILWWLALLTVVAAAVRVVATYDIFSITFDEPAHIAAGMQLLDKDRYSYEALHPPLARVAAAIGPYLAGYKSQHGGDMWIEGRRLFYAKSGHPDDGMLTLARAGILPFMIACLVLIWLWTSRYVGPVEGALAVIVLGNLPVFLAHSGLATTDAAFAATFAAAFFAFLLWLEYGSIARGLLLGAAIALAVCTKLSALLFLPAACGAVLLHRWWCDRPYWQPLRLFAAWPSVLAGLGTFFVTVWVVYGCHADPFYGIAALARGVAELAAFAGTGEPSFFLGRINLHGSPAFFPVLILVKSPLPFLAAVAIGMAVVLRSHRRDWRRMAPLIAAAAIVASVIPSTINIGLRHVLPIFPLLAIVAAIGLGRLLAQPLLSARAAIAAAGAGLLLVWQVGETAAAAPDYLTYFNQLAAGEKQRIVTGSDLDWGQDLKRLAAVLKQRHVDRVSLAVHTSADLRRHDDLPTIETLYPGEPATGWIAISEQMRAFYCAGYRWLDAYRPVARVGDSIRLYYVPGPSVAPSDPQAWEWFNWSVPLPCSPRAPAPASPAPRRPA
jgi:hypothetical protein